MTTPTVLLVGARGFGAVHLRNLDRLQDRVRLIGLVDPAGAPESGYGADAPHWPSLDEAFASGIRPDIVIVATPTGTHFPLASAALEHGADLYLEKPPVATMEQFTALLDLQQRTGRAVQIGFQSMGSHALTELAGLGTATSVATWGAWTRDAAYWTRSAWAGHRVLNGAPVTDGVLTNALSHAIATALRIAGARRREDIARVELELLHAADIQADDTSAVRITLQDGRVISGGLTLASAVSSAPLIEVRTPARDVVFSYTEDTLTEADGAVRQTGRTDLFEELLDHRATGIPLSSALVDSGAYMEVLEAVRTAPDPVAIPTAQIDEVGEGQERVAAVRDAAFWVERAARSGALFSELHAPFAPAAASAAVADLRLDGNVIAVCDDGSTVTSTSSPRPFLHPIRTLGDIRVTDAHPADHDWHLGLSFGIQHAGDVNFWGGPTYVRDEGYRWLDDHGRIVTTSFEHTDDGFTRTAEWRRPDGSVALIEDTSLAVSPEDDAWTFLFTTTLRAGAQAIELGSPGSHGRVGGGYGGLAWRLAPATDVEVRTPDASGEASVHGAIAPWVSFAARFADGEATVALAPADAATAADPWFVRVDDYPGIGSALAWDSPVQLAGGESLTRSFRGLVADGRRDAASVERMLAG
ncbi:MULTISPECIES: DUF6807 family protein [unclassified Microbacterium]|uniref:DUF6807 family protein n=1 Tax=unclassified Microbacterium TaxID=2609290 RepID=UPI0012F71F4A|nr:DUF6807 family protein [Microbacterium sp. MAH-37]MVQ42880.1 hypothetical protein [Microbacterium sp. MAH-37]